MSGFIKMLERADELFSLVCGRCGQTRGQHCTKLLENSGHITLCPPFNNITHTFVKAVEQPMALKDDGLAPFSAARKMMEATIDPSTPPHDQPLLPVEVPAKTEWVNHPEHYGGDTTYEVVKCLEAWDQLDWCVASAITYLARLGKKHPSLEGQIQELEKAAWFVNRRIEQLKSKGGS